MGIYVNEKHGFKVLRTGPFFAILLIQLLIFMKHLILIAFVNLFFNLVISPRAFSDCAMTLGQLHRIIERNSFQTRRDFMGYANYFPDSFLKHLGSLDQKGHWIDSGSGEGQALKDFFDPEVFKTFEMDALLRPIMMKTYDEKPVVTGISYKMETELPKGSKLHFKVGKYFEALPTNDIQKADIITDLYGVASYSPRVEQVLSKYHAILKPGGKAYIFLGFVTKPNAESLARSETREAPFVHSQVKKLNGEVVSLVNWVMSLPGFKAKLETQGNPNSRFPIPTTLVLEKTEESSQIPFLRLVGSDFNTPPKRQYEEVRP